MYIAVDKDKGARQYVYIQVNLFIMSKTVGIITEVSKMYIVSIENGLGENRVVIAVRAFKTLRGAKAFIKGRGYEVAVVR